MFADYTFTVGMIIGRYMDIWLWGLKFVESQSLRDQLQRHLSTVCCNLRFSIAHINKSFALKPSLRSLHTSHRPLVADRM
jgi:hypothetical protein